MKKKVSIGLGLGVLLLSTQIAVEATEVSPPVTHKYEESTSKKNSIDQQGNLILNGDFETGDTQGWEFTKIADSSSFSVKNHNGSYAGYIYDGGYLHTQSIPVIGGETYSFSMAFASVYSGYHMTASLKGFDTEGNLLKEYYLSIPNEESGVVSLENFVLPQDTATLQLEISLPMNSEFYIDNVNLEASSVAPITFNDKILEAEVKKELKLTEDQLITEENILNLNELRTKEAGITDLSGLEYALNLEIVTFDSEKISSMAPLKNLGKLISVGVPRCTNLPMSEILRLRYLRALDLSGISYSQAEFNQLSAYRRMTDLRLMNCGLDNISFMSSMTSLDTVAVTGNNLTSLQGIENSYKTLKILLASENRLEKISLNGFTNLQILSLESNNISEITLKNLPALQTISLRFNNISNINNWSELPELKDFRITNNPLQELNFSKIMPNLEILSLESCDNIADFSDINDLQNIQELYLNYTDINDSQMQEIGTLEMLNFLGLNGNQLTNISFIKNFPNLTKLALNANAISDISNLAKTNIEYVANNQNIVLPNTKINTPNNLVLKDILGNLPILSNWNGEGKIDTDNNQTTLTWTSMGNNSFDFMSEDTKFSGTVAQVVQ